MFHSERRGEPMQSSPIQIPETLGDSPSFVAPPGPVVTFLSPNPRHSRSAVRFLNQMLQFPLLDLSLLTESTTEAIDRLDQLHFGGSSSIKWDSVACICPTSGTILHFLSLANDESSHETREEENDVQSSHSLIAIHGGVQSALLYDQEYQFTTHTFVDVVLQSRRRLAEQLQNRQLFQPNDAERGSVLSWLESRLRGKAMRLMNLMGKQLSSSWLLAKFPQTSTNDVILDLRPFNLTSNKLDVIPWKQKDRHHAFQLRELALPFFPERSSLQQKLSRSSLMRPMPGLYQFVQATCIKYPLNASKCQTTTDDGLVLRPIPSATEDFRLSPPSLVCQCFSLAEAKESVENELGGKTAKIGWRGDGQNGSLIVSHPSVRGMDVRLVEIGSGNVGWVMNSYFHESQEALLAASLDDLQSSHVVSEGKGEDEEGSNYRLDPKILNADCWVEVRSNVKNPKGFVSKGWSPGSLWNVLTSRNRATAVAKPPDLPYE
ncbi:hypothetical protein ACHAWX_005678 [Stephanocyclus meneghinianus]